jgi:hypothetical protein
MEEFGNILPRVLKKHVRNEGGPVLAVLAGVWPRVAGAAVAAQARPLAFCGGTLTLAVGCPTWAAQLTGLRETIRGVINAALGRPLVRHVRVKLVSAGQLNLATPAAEREDQAAPAPTWSERDLPALAELDPELRQVISRSYAKYFARPHRKVN